ncbi:hypothetical protein Hanom_Chr04g00354191 [Helianthus anomalus]
MATKYKPQGPRCKKFEIWTKMAKVPKPQGPKWQFTLFSLTLSFSRTLNTVSFYKQIAATTIKLTTTHQQPPSLDL